MINIQSFGITDRGLVREQNEDAYYLDDENRIYAVADGLGGLPRGADASEMAINLLTQLLESESGDTNGKIDFSRIFREINAYVFSEGRSSSGDIGMGTTLTAAKIRGSSMLIGHVGDTALLRFQEETWDQLTSDHTMEQEIRERLGPGEDAFIPEYFSHTLTRCIGQADDLVADILQVEIESRDRFLLCSDGVTKVIQPAELFRLQQTCQDPKSLVEGIVTLGNNRGGPDNITAIALFLD